MQSQRAPCAASERHRIRLAETRGFADETDGYEGFASGSKGVRAARFARPCEWISLAPECAPVNGWRRRGTRVTSRMGRRMKYRATRTRWRFVWRTSRWRWSCTACPA